MNIGLVLGAVALAFVVIVAIWAIISPRSLYWKLHAWQHRDPDANEPSDASYMLWRLGSVVALVVMGITGTMLWSSWQDSQTYETCKAEILGDLKSAYHGKDTTLAELEAAAELHGLEVRGEKPWYEFHDGSRTVASITAARGPVCTLPHQQ